MGAAAVAAPRVRFAVVKTSGLRSKQGLVFSGGSFSVDVGINYSAFVVQHNETLFLFDSGLGSQVAEQYRQDMPWWARAFAKYEEPVRTAQQQLRDAGIAPIGRIVLSHAHWDHASALVDFPGAEVWLPEEELAFVRRAEPGAGTAWPTQVSAASLIWKTLQFSQGPYEGFDRSLDLFGDGSVVLVPMFGHTPGSVGMFLTTSSGRRFLFVGDVVWNAGALKQGSPKFFAARWMVDRNVEGTAATIEKIRAAMQRDPALVVVPAHDGGVQDGLGYFPAWVN